MVAALAAVAALATAVPGADGATSWPVSDGLAPCTFNSSGTLDLVTGQFTPSGGGAVSMPVLLRTDGDGIQHRELHCTTLTVSAAATVRVVPEGALEARATGDVTIAGVIDLSGSGGGQGTTCGGGTTGRPGVAALGPTSAGCPGGGGGFPISMFNGMAGQGPTGGGGGHNGGGGGGQKGGGGSGGGVAGGAGGESGGVPATPGGVAHGAGGTTSSTGGGGGGTPADPGFNASLYGGGRFQAGSGGGGGGGSVNAASAMAGVQGGGGGGGGGALYLTTPESISVTGTIFAKGAGGGAGAGAGAGGGGGGSGGSIWLAAPAITIGSSGLLSTAGGIGGPSGGGSGSSGSVGADGRIRLSANSFAVTGATVPMYDGTNAVGKTYTSAYSQSLTVNRGGDGSGTVTSVPAGIDCGSDCSEAYDPGQTVTLSASAATGSTFTGWSGDCSGTGDCVVTLSAARAVTATFALPAPPPDTGGGSGSDPQADSTPAPGGTTAPPAGGTTAGGTTVAPPAVVPAAGCIVPKLKRKSLPAARKLLARAGCKLGKVAKKRAARALRGKVLSQKPAAGKRLPRLARIGLVIGR